MSHLIFFHTVTESLPKSTICLAFFTKRRTFMSAIAVMDWEPSDSQGDVAFANSALSASTAEVYEFDAMAIDCEPSGENNRVIVPIGDGVVLVINAAVLGRVARLDNAIADMILRVDVN